MYLFSLLSITYYYFLYLMLFKNKEILKYGIFLSMLFILYFIRLDTTDMKEYYFIYENYDKLSKDRLSRYEPGFLLLIEYFSYLSFSKEMFYGLVSTFNMLAVFLLCSKFKKSFYFSIILYFSTYFIYNEQIQIRQGISTALIIFSILIYLKIRNIKSILIFILSPFFHYGSLICIPFIFLIKINLRAFYLICIFLSIILGYVFGFLFIIEKIGYDTLTSISALSYLESENNYRIDFFSLRNIKGLLFSSIVLYLWNYISSDYRLYFVSKIYLFGVMIQFLFADIYIYSIRLSQFLLITEVIIIPEILIILGLRQYKILSICYVICLIQFSKYLYIS